ncbi:D-alanyl-D-alanine carboxypeptidase/D-alanyl-D-alanine endopeptidase [Corynebacterium diphtheriae]|uniref:D-alanyl-D-alanine carboxypeptidase/D-alanyl-D-alanine endopeptidase n=1 Tax=Corynebacterium diphtheriae TaxID=1717 RepID=UPI0002469050|nr:D-alanyl-D-alanine carboxypeptidase/D-alanyl-D-alanine-endopeptidase [Corynebacterium diphtheriae]AEX81869.1 D-alanyl-D-alanine carboxypeptidase [Corynebacterium diphtheriae HC04]AEX81909.1 putative D-Ala D-Ala carboxypeptidase [Corynebacterium diphtheriae HC04]
MLDISSRLVAMNGTKWWAATIAATVVVAGTVTTGAVVQHKHALTHQAPYKPIEPARGITALTDKGTTNNEALRSTVGALAQDPRLAGFAGKIVDATTGEVILEKDADKPLTPASATKMLTATAALYELGPEHRITTEVIKQDDQTVVIKAAGDVWLTDERLDQLARKIKEQMPSVNTVLVDTSAWSGDKILGGWDPDDVNAGYVAPLEPIMLYGGRLGAKEGDVPRSHNPGLDVASALAQRLGAGTKGYTNSATGEVIATTESEALEKRISQMMQHSDNVMAEAIGREIDATQPVQATLRILSEHGITIGASEVADNSGLSLHNRITPALLTQVATKAVTDPEVHSLILALPVAGGSGTLIDRYAELDGRGWVRAKTGTLTGVSALVGVVPSTSGHIYSFGLISNGSEILEARAALDTIASALRDA